MDKERNGRKKATIKCAGSELVCTCGVGSLQYTPHVRVVQGIQNKLGILLGDRSAREPLYSCEFTFVFFLAAPSPAATLCLQWVSVATDMYHLHSRVRHALNILVGG